MDWMSVLRLEYFCIWFSSTEKFQAEILCCLFATTPMCTLKHMHTYTHMHVLLQETKNKHTHSQEGNIRSLIRVQELE